MFFAVCVAALAFLAVMQGYMTAVPACDSERTVETLQRAFNSSPQALAARVTAQASEQHRQVAWHGDQRPRECRALVLLSSAERIPVAYFMQGRDGAPFVLTVVADAD
ncbi:hypothetical protein CKO44_06040 [Rubrivivax gelatinosus]|uniref:hypothetical protein n=1 Tax=Rubrivivax gelatinosus TaxID=28068 RepID=UPI00190764F6|nr:hypothetical protein [Rubrivivax gelatinosus]MBK1613033.1 hypothetical protein [Rubrivivax gelatinosus]MBZ8143345.1 hypothetical protein [Rubrivivax gelatinosus]